MREQPPHPPGLTWTDTGAALACALIVSLLFCLNQDFPHQPLLQALFLSMFVVPAAFLITAVVELPILHLVLKRGYTHPFIYVLLPGLAVLAVCVLPDVVFGSSFSVLREGGKDLVLDGAVVWQNLGWYLLYWGEPALWASLAGLLFWLMRVRRTRTPLRK